MPDTPIDAHRVAGEAVAFAQALVRIDTVNPYSGDPTPGGEANGQDFLQHLLEESGARVTRFEPPPDVYERMGVLGPRGRSFEGRPNLVGEFRFGSGRGTHVVIQGHVDTVGVTGMSIEPFSGEIRDDRLWGRGSSDMKGGMAAGIAAVREAARHGSLDGTVTFLSVVDEECDGGGAGALACLDRGYRGDVAICLDGPGAGVSHGCHGVVTARIDTFGKGGHAAGSPSEPSALERGLELAQAVLKLRDERPLPVNLGVFRSGTHAAVVPSHAELHLNAIYSWDEACAAERAGHRFGGAHVREALEAAVRAVEPDARIEWVKDLIPFATPVDHPLVRSLAASHRAVAGAEPPVGTFQAWSDACYLSRMANVPTVLYGAGTPGRAHAPDEWAEIPRIERCAEVLADYLVRTLRTPREARPA